MKSYIKNIHTIILKKNQNKFNSYSYKLIMDTEVENQAPLLATTSLVAETVERTPIQTAISQTFESTSHLANLLPTGSVIAFQFLSPIFTNHGSCDPISQAMTIALVAIFGLSCFLLSFTDSFSDKDGNICYGFATIHGLYVLDGNITLPPEVASKYKIRFIDFVHAFMSIMVFAAVVLFDDNVVNCFYPSPSDEVKHLLGTLPIGLGVLFSMLFVVFPTQRHGIGFPVTNNIIGDIL